MNNPTQDIDAYSTAAKAAGATYFAGQLEKGEKGTPHIQATLGFKSLVRTATIQKIFGKCHHEPAKSPFDAWEYCQKEDSRIGPPLTWGTPPARRNKKGDLKKQNELLLEMGATKAVKDGVIPLRDWVKVKQAIDGIRAETVKHPEIDGKLPHLWYWGKPGTGKSRKARDENPNHFLKACNKWWNGYAGQPVVIIDDLDSNILGHHLKIWGDRYPFPAETKGGCENIRPAKIIVTSNYSIEMLWPDDKQMREAIARRYKQVHFTEPFGYENSKYHEFLKNSNFFN